MIFVLVVSQTLVFVYLRLCLPLQVRCQFLCRKLHLMKWYVQDTGTAPPTSVVFIQAWFGVGFAFPEKLLGVELQFFLAYFQLEEMGGPCKAGCYVLHVSFCVWAKCDIIGNDKVLILLFFDLGAGVSAQKARKIVIQTALAINAIFGIETCSSLLEDHPEEYVDGS